MRQASSAAASGAAGALTRTTSRLKSSRQSTARSADDIGRVSATTPEAEGGAPEETADEKARRERLERLQKLEEAQALALELQLEAARQLAEAETAEAAAVAAASAVAAGRKRQSSRLSINPLRRRASNAAGIQYVLSDIHERDSTHVPATVHTWHGKEVALSFSSANSFTLPLWACWSCSH